MPFEGIICQIQPGVNFLLRFWMRDDKIKKKPKGVCFYERTADH